MLAKKRLLAGTEAESLIQGKVMTDQALRGYFDACQTTALIRLAALANCGTGSAIQVSASVLLLKAFPG